MTASVHEALALARQYHVTMRINGDRIHMTAPQKPPELVLEAIRLWKPRIIKILRGEKRAAWSFTLDGCRTVTAIRPGGCTQAEMAQHLENQFGPGRVSGLRGCA